MVKNNLEPNKFLTYRDFIPGLISTTLSTLETTRIVTSPAPALFFFKNSFTLLSRTSPNLVCGRPINTQKRTSYGNNLQKWLTTVHIKINYDRGPSLLPNTFMYNKNIRTFRAVLVFLFHQTTPFQT